MLLCLLAPPLTTASDLVTLTDVRWIDDPANDGDSFKVNVDGRRLHLRLYFVDTLEETFGFNAVLDRIQRQQRHFGLDNRRSVIDFGGQASAFTAQQLARPFRVHTSYAQALGRANRIYAFVETAEGEDLAHLLVKNGLVRIHGETHADITGAPSKTTIQRLNKLRDVAILTRNGIWRETDPDKLVTMREQQRQDDREIMVLRERACDEPPLNLNTAPSQELQRIPGLGPVLAERIIAGRLYQSVKELIRVRGIGKKTLAKIARHLTTGKKTDGQPMTAADLVSLTDVHWIDDSANDGDSFKVNASGQQLHLRLYFVDTLDAAFGINDDSDRIRRQQRHFGLENISSLIDFGGQANAFTSQLLARPFLVRTHYTKAPRTKAPRTKAPGTKAAGVANMTHAFVETAEGEDLAHLLVKNGLARIHNRAHPDITCPPSETIIQQLNDLRVWAMLKRSGIWRETNPEALSL